MDALARADEALARARARANVITPEDATSPMDAASTVQIPRQFIASVDPRQQADSESTMIISRGSIGPSDGWGPSPAR